MEILKHVEFVDIVKVNLHIAPTGHLSISFDSYEPGKQVVIDEKVLPKIEEEILKRFKNLSLNAQTKPALREHIERLCSELYRNGLIAVEEIPGAPDDHYVSIRKELKR